MLILFTRSQSTSSVLKRQQRTARLSVSTLSFDQAARLGGFADTSCNFLCTDLTSAAIAEFFADIALCPLEATRIRLVSQPDFANGLVGGFSKILSQEGVMAFYGGFVSLLSVVLV